tara:strand:+ start:1344 stop:2915 length:1572 start_codon:yes stop_codon:yes gene_type:complete
MSDTDDDEAFVNTGGLGVAEIKDAIANDPRSKYMDTEKESKAEKQSKQKMAEEQGRIPDLMRIGAIPSSYGQMLHTDVIDVTTFSQRRARWTLSRVAGFLHSDSKITLGITPLTSATAFYPLNIGVSNLIQTATLSIGNNVVCSIDDYSDFHAYQSLFISNEDNKEREQYLSQRCIAHKPVYDDRTANTTDKPPNSAKTIGLDVGRNPVVPAAGGVGAFQLLPFMNNNGTSAQGIADAPVYSVYLSDLFPFLRFNSLPCFMLDEEIHIDLTFTDEVSSLSGASLSRRMCVASSDDGNNAVSYQIDRDECKLIYDSISYDGEIMEKYAQQNPKLSFQYVDYRLAKRTGDETAFANLTLPVGGNGRLVSKVMFNLAANDNFTPLSLLNGVTSYGEMNIAANILYNDRFEFNVDRTNSALLFHTTQQAEGKVPMITHDEYVKRATTSSLTAETFEGRDQSSRDVGLGQLFRWTAVRPNKNERVNNKGIDLTYKASALAGGDYTLRCYLELLKVATIENGRFNCYFA